MFRCGDFDAGGMSVGHFFVVVVPHYLHLGIGFPKANIVPDLMNPYPVEVSVTQGFESASSFT